MAVPGESREGTFCERCFGPLAEGDAVCPDCGAPTSAAPAGAESPVHRELAQANLLRLRGDLDGSEKALLAVLRRYPNDPLAHQMLGEVCAERGELDRAVEWFELALDLAPGSAEAQRRLQEARERLESRQTADTAETLGLPTNRPALTWVPLAAVGALVLVAAGIALWPHRAAPRPLQATVAAPTTPVTAPPVASTTPSTTDSAPASADANLAGTEEERKLLDALRTQAGAVRVQSAMLDPRTGTLAISYEVAEMDDPKPVAIALGRAALGIEPTAMTASLRALRGGRLVFAADLPRASMGNADPLTNLWPVETTSANAPGSNPPAAGGTTASGTSNGSTSGAGSVPPSSSSSLPGGSPSSGTGNPPASPNSPSGGNASGENGGASGTTAPGGSANPGSSANPPAASGPGRL